MTVEEGLAVSGNQPKIARVLQTLSDVGLTYVRPRAAGDDPLGRGGAADQARHRAGEALDGPHLLHPRRTDHRPALRRRPSAAPRSAAPRRQREHGRCHRAQPRRRQVSGLGHRPRPRGRRRRRPHRRRRHPRKTSPSSASPTPPNSSPKSSPGDKARSSTEWRKGSPRGSEPAGFRAPYLPAPRAGGDFPPASWGPNDRNVLHGVEEGPPGDELAGFGGPPTPILARWEVGGFPKPTRNGHHLVIASAYGEGGNDGSAAGAFSPGGGPH